MTEALTLDPTLGTIDGLVEIIESVSFISSPHQQIDYVIGINHES